MGKRWIAGAPMGVKTECMYSDSPGSHTRANGHVSRQTCVYCRGPLDAASGVYGVFVWSGDGRYHPDDALSMWAREPDAQAALYGTEEVVRWVPDFMLAQAQRSTGRVS